MPSGRSDSPWSNSHHPGLILTLHRSWMLHLRAEPRASCFQMNQRRNGWQGMLVNHQQADRSPGFLSSNAFAPSYTALQVTAAFLGTGRLLLCYHSFWTPYSNWNQAMESSINDDCWRSLSAFKNWIFFLPIYVLLDFERGGEKLDRCPPNFACLVSVCALILWLSC